MTPSMPRSRCRVGETEYPYFLTGTVVGWRAERLQTRKGTTRIITYTMTDRVEPVYNLDMGAAAGPGGRKRGVRA